MKWLEYLCCSLHSSSMIFKDSLLHELNTSFKMSSLVGRSRTTPLSNKHKSGQCVNLLLQFGRQPKADYRCRLKSHAQDINELTINVYPESLIYFNVQKWIQEIVIITPTVSEINFKYWILFQENPFYINHWVTR